MPPLCKAWASGLRMGGCLPPVFLCDNISQAEPLVVFLCDVTRKQVIYNVIKAAGCVNGGPPEEWALERRMVEVPPGEVQAETRGRGLWFDPSLRQAGSGFSLERSR